MNFTSLIAELLVAGLLATVWVALLVTLLAGPNPFQWFLDRIEKHNAVFVPLFLAFAYMLGVAVDRGADWVFDQADKRLALQFHERNQTRDQLVQVYQRADDRTINFLEYLRSRVRVARSAVVNLSLILGLAISVVRYRKLPRYESSRRAAIRTVCFAILPLVLLSGYAWYRVSWSYYERLDQAFTYLPATAPASR